MKYKFIAIVFISLIIGLLFVGKYHRRDQSSSVTYNKSLDSLLRQYKIENDTLKIKSLDFLLENARFHEDDTQKIDAKLLDYTIRTSLENCRSSLLTGSISFYAFTEFVLPYRVANEPLHDWRKLVRDSLGQFFDSIRNKTKDLITITSSLNKRLQVGFKYSENSTNALSKPWPTLISEKSGNCSDMALSMIYPLRAYGIPVSYDFINYWGNVNGKGHAWNVLFDKGHKIPFLGLETSPEDDYFPFNLIVDPIENKLSTFRLPAKVFRLKFSKSSIPENSFLFSQDLPYEDVTQEYSDVANLEINLSNKQRNLAYYICVFNNGNWRPTFFGIEKSGKVVFEKMACGLIYLPISVDNDQNYATISEPIYLQSDKAIHFFTPDTSHRIDIRLQRVQSIISDQLDAIAKLQNWLDPNFVPTMKKIARGDLKTKPIDGKVYSLYIWENGNWHFAAKTTAQKGLVIFKNVLSDCVYRMIGPESKNIERIFIVDDNRIVWY